VLGFSAAPTGPATVVDDGDADYSQAGDWTTVTTGGYQGDYRQAFAGYTGSVTATYTFTGLTPGAYYQVAATWPAAGSGFNGATYTVQSGNTASPPVAVNQNVAPVGFADAVNGGTWQPLGVFRADAATLTVTVSGYFVNAEADGVRLQQVQGDTGADDDFGVQPTSPTIDAGDPAAPFATEPAPNGGRVNLGHTGNTPAAAASPASLVQVLSPNGLEKLTTGQPVILTWRNNGLVGTPTPVQTVINLDGSQAYYRLGESSGTAASDASNNGRTATYVGSPTLGVAGSPVGGSDTAVQLNGAGQYVRLPAGFADFSRGLTLETWAYPTAVTDSARFIDLGSGNSYDDSVFLGREGTSDNLIFSVYRGYSQVAFLRAPGAIGLNAWQHFAVTMDAAGVIRLFKNGQVIATGSGQLPNAVARAGNFLGHGNPGSGAADFAGRLDEAAVFDFALGDDRVLAHATAQDFGTAKVELLQNGSVVQTIAAAAPNLDRLAWTVPNLPGGNYRIRVTSNLPASPSDVSDAPFLIAPAGHDFYVTAASNDANSGKAPDQPMAGLAAVLQACHLGAGDVVHVGAGTYVLYRNLQFLPDESGVRVNGPALGVATLDRANTSDNGFDASYGIELLGADDVTLNRLTITGGVGGVSVPRDAGSDRLTVSNSDVFGNAFFGLFVDNGNADARLLNNTVHNNTSYGIRAYGARALVSGNQVYAQTYGIDSSYNGAAADGITLSGNTVRDNAFIGVQANGAVTVSGNTVYGQLATFGYGITANGGALVTGNVVRNNYLGINSDSTVDGNRAFANTIGIQANSGALVQDNKVYSNQTGIQTGNNLYGQIQNNVVYANTNQGILVQGSFSGGRVTNNTVFQSVGDAVRLQGGNQYVQVRNNILDVLVGNALFVAPDSATGLVNANNVTADPLFVDPDGADNVLGYRSSDGFDGGADDNFYVAKTSPAIDAGDSWNAPRTDALGFARADDPGTPNAGSNDYFAAPAAGPFPTGGTAQNLRGDDTYVQLNLAFAFPFYDGTYTTAFVTSNGFVQFGEGATSSPPPTRPPACWPTAASPRCGTTCGPTGPATTSSSIPQWPTR
jgi:parallel beta-helix repeat protein